jgi:hypothetical protein
MTKDEMPVGFAMAPAMNPPAMEKFSSLSEEQKRDVILGIHALESREEMTRYVSSIVNKQ